MSNEKVNTKKTIKIKESDLVNLIEKIVSEAVEIKKKEWISEQENKKASLIETKVAELEAKLAGITKK